jgi:hypothetical protein
LARRRFLRGAAPFFTRYTDKNDPQCPAMQTTLTPYQQELARLLKLSIARATTEVHAFSAGPVTGASWPWDFGRGAVVGKGSGQVEDGTGTGPLVALVLGETGAAQAFATALCVTTETARIFDADAPELDDGVRLSALARRIVSDEA